jgi:hypothetical protein
MITVSLYPTIKYGKTSRVAKRNSYSNIFALEHLIDEYNYRISSNEKLLL